MGPYFNTSQLAKLFEQALCSNEKELFTRLAVKACLSSGRRVQDILSITLQEYGIPEVRELTIVFKKVARLTQLSEIFTMLKHSSPNVRWAAVNTFAYFGNRDQLHLLEAMSSDEDAMVRKQAAVAISSICNPAYQPVKNDSFVGVLDPLEEAIARLTLGEPEAISDVSVLLSLLTHGYPIVREWATQALVSREPSTVIQYIGAKVQQGGPIALGEVNALRDVGGTNAISLLIQCLPLSIPSLRQESKTGVHNALRQLGKDAADALLKAFTKDSWVRSHEGRLLAEVAGASALDALLAALGDPLRAVRYSAEEGLTALGQLSVFPLVAMLDSLNRESVISALRVLGEIGAPEGVEAIVSKTRSTNPNISLAAIGALVKFENRRALEILIDTLASPRWETRKQAVKVLGYWSWDDLDIISLLDSAANDSHTRVREAVDESLWRLAKKGDGALLNRLETLVRLVQGGDDAARRKSQRELEILGTLAPYLFEHRFTAVLHSPQGEEKEKRLEREVIELAKRGYIHSEVRTRLRQQRRRTVTAGEIVAAEVVRNRRHDPDIPRPITDEVHFSIVGPRCVTVRQTFLLNVWAHSESMQDLIISLEGSREAVRIGSKGPVPVDRGTVLTVRLSIPAFQLEDEDTIFWTGTKGNANFPVTVPETARDGDHVGLARFFASGFQIARLSFLVRVGMLENDMDDLTSSEYRARSAFASYSSEDKEEVLGRIQGMLKVFPDLDIFLDVASLRSGEEWQQRLEHEIIRRDVFYLFWSSAAAQSKWVDWEWRTALRTKGIDYIDPVPLDSPDRVPPPAELSKLHFNEWTLHYRQ